MGFCRCTGRGGSGFGHGFAWLIELTGLELVGDFGEVAGEVEVIIVKWWWSYGWKGGSWWWIGGLERVVDGRQGWSVNNIVVGNPRLQSQNKKKQIRIIMKIKMKQT